MGKHVKMLNTLEVSLCHEPEPSDNFKFDEKFLPTKAGIEPTLVSWDNTPKWLTSLTENHESYAISD